MLNTKLTIATLADSTLVTLLNSQLLTALFLMVNRFIQLTFSNPLSLVKQFAYDDSMKPNLIIGKSTKIKAEVHSFSVQYLISQQNS